LASAEDKIAMADEGKEPIVVTPGMAQFRADPLGFYLRARDFFETAEFARGRPKRFSPVAAFLYCRALELALKAFLLARGNTVEAVRVFNHDLVHLLTEAHARGLDAVVALDATEKRVVIAANGDYLGQTLGYFDLFTTLSGFPSQPETAALAGVTGKVLDAIEKGCYEAGDGDWRPFGRPTS